MTKTAAITLTAAGVIVYSLLRKTAAAGSLNFFPGSVRFQSMDNLTPVFSIGLGVQNTSNQSFTLNSFAGSLYSDGYYVGNLSTFEQKTIMPNSQQTVYVLARLELNGIVNDIIRAIENKNFSQVLEMKATANIDRLQVPIRLKYTIGL